VIPFRRVGGDSARSLGGTVWRSEGVIEFEAVPGGWYLVCIITGPSGIVPSVASVILFVLRVSGCGGF
jgi:hypothetical protein